MQLFNDVNKVLNSKSTSIALFTITGASRILSDYQNAQTREEKKKVLIQDYTILLGAAAGITGYTKFSEHMSKSFNKNRKHILQGISEHFNIQSVATVGKKVSPTIKFIAKHFVNNMIDTTKNCLDNACLVASGIAGAVGANYILEYGHKLKKDKQAKSAPKEQDKNITVNNIQNIEHSQPISAFNRFKEKMLSGDQLDNIVSENTRKNIFSNITNMPEMKVFTSTMIGTQSFEIAEEKTFKNKLKHTTKNIITGTMVPIFYLSIASNLTKSLKPIFRVPISFASMIGGTMYTNKILESKMKQFDT